MRVQSSLRHAPTQPAPPLAKRQRTDDDGGWKHSATGIGNRSGKFISRNQKRSDSFYEDLPDISLAGDGVYGVFSQGSRPARSSNAVPSPDVENMQNQLGRISLSGGFQQLAIAPAPAPTPPPRERTPNLNQNRQPPQPPPQRTHNPNNLNRPEPQHQYRQQPPHPQQRNPSRTGTPVSRTGPVPPQPNRPQNLGLGRNVNVLRQQSQQQARHGTLVLAHPAQSTSSNHVGGSISDKDLHDEVARLRARLEQVRGRGITIIDLHR